jgi:MSHA biogenesis protein MshQ
VGNTVGSSTVACVAASSPCTDSGLTAGTPYHYRLFARDSNGNYSATGVVPSGSPCTPASSVSSFNVVETGANAVTGRIHTKIAGQDIAVDIVALDASNAIATGFTGDVAVELVDNSGGGACASLPLIKTLSNQTFTVGNSGRHPLSAGQFEANAYRNVKFRISHPTTSPTVTSCSADAFANRPAQFVNILVRDANRTTAGTTNTLDNTSNPGTGVVHNAGRPFRIDATARNGAGSPATTTLYAADSGQPVAVLSQCGVAAVCPVSLGVVTTTGAYSALNGVITNTTASYNDVGSFNLALEDQTFAAVDAGDGTSTAVRYIPSSAAVTAGRFVPDYFSLEAGATITPRSDIGACSASTFTYMGERMTLGFTLKARDSASNVTPNYAGATLGALVLDSLASYGFGAIDSIAPTPLTARLDLSLSGATGSWSAGSADVTVPLALNRAAAPDGPYTSLKIGMAPGDPDGVALQAAALNLDADNSGTPESAQLGAAQTVRFGHLRLLNAYGSELLDIRLPVRAEYYTGTNFWTLNSSDNCTVVPRSSIALGNYLPPPAGTAVSATNMGVAPTDHRPASDIVLAGGSATIVLAKPSPAATGSLDVVLNLGTGIVSPNSCATGAFAGGTAASLQYLLGNWCGANYDRAPSARVKLGSPKAPFIYLRERY